MKFVPTQESESLPPPLVGQKFLIDKLVGSRGRNAIRLRHSGRVTVQANVSQTSSNA